MTAVLREGTTVKFFIKTSYGGTAWYGEPGFDTATPVIIADGTVIDAQLPDFAIMTVNATEADGSPSASSCAYAYDLSNIFVSTSCDGNDGATGRYT